MRTYLPRRFSRKGMKQKLLAMKLTVILMIAFSLQLSANTAAQQVTLHVKDTKIETVFKEIEKQTGYYFAYTREVVRDAKPVTVSVTKMQLVEVLNVCLKTQGLDYTITDKVISVRKAEGEVDDGVVAAPPLIDVRGKVVNEKGEPVAGASVTVKGVTGKGTSTDGNGNFILSGVDENATLVISGVTIDTYETKLNGRKELSITATTKVAKLDDVVVGKGYYNTTQALNTGNVSTISSKEIERQPVGDPLAAMIARVPGLFIQQTSGVNGRRLNISLRGRNSLDNGTDPLIIVDGMPYNSAPLNSSTNQFTAGGLASPLNYLNPSDIDEIQVLKDGDATAIYGSRGANGVILITTKRGKEGKTQVDVSVYTGYSQAPLKVKLMNTTQYLAARREAFQNDNQVPMPWDVDVNGTWDTTRSTDWQKLLIGNTASMTEANIAISGGSHHTKFRLGTTYRKEGVIYPGSFYSSKGAVQFNVTHSTLNRKFSASLTGNYVYTTDNLPAFGVDAFVFTAPNAPDPFLSDGSLNWANSTWTNPFASLRTQANESAKNLLSNIKLLYNPIDRLEVKLAGSYNTVDFSQINLQPYSSIDPASPVPPNFLRTHKAMSNKLTSWIIEPQVSYSFKLVSGKVDVLVGSTFQNKKSDYQAISGTGFVSDALLHSLGAASSIQLSGTNAQYAYTALFARFGYNLNNKYIINVTGRRDGSSRFGPGKRFGNFGALGVAWILSKEHWFKNVSWLSFGKLRSSIATTGNDEIGDYKYLDTYSSSTIPYQGVPALTPTQLTNPNYGWEKVTKLEIAAELSFFKDKLGFNISYFDNRTGNQLVQYGLPSITGFTNIRQNLPAIISNTGIEIELQTVNIKSARFSWTSRGHISFPRNKLVSYPNLKASSYARRFVEGLPINSLRFMYQYNGIDPATGLYTFEDINGNGSLTSTQDQIPVFIGHNFFGGLQNTFVLGAFEFDCLIQFTKQNGDGLFFPARGIFNQGTGNMISEVKNPTVNIPLTQSQSTILTNGSNFSNSTGNIIDASFIRLKNLSLNYDVKLPETATKYISHFSLFLRAQNLLTITGYRGYDPETPSRSFVVPTLRTFTFGFQAKL